MVDYSRSRFILKLMLLFVPLLLIGIWFFIIENGTSGGVGGIYYNLAPLMGAFVLGVYICCYELGMSIYTYRQRFDGLETRENQLCLLIGGISFVLSVLLFFFLLGG